MHAILTIILTLISFITFEFNFEEFFLIFSTVETIIVLLLSSNALAINIDVVNKKEKVFINYKIKNDKIMIKNFEKLFEIKI